MPVKELESPREIVVAEVDGKRSLDGELENAVPQTGWGAPARERREKPLRPKVLVDVDCEQGA
ncbi:MAG: hypothetical protein ACRDQ2_10820 [Gaiellales bacterium]